VRIAIVNDMPTACEALRRVVSRLPGHTICWIATGGEEAVSLASRDRPDLILMDLMMPGVDGVEATRRIMRQSPCAILIVTASVSGAIGMVYDAMSWGAIDAVDTPVLGPHEDLSGASAIAEKISTIERFLGETPESAGHSMTGSGTAGPPLLLIGASTGGPAAVCELLCRLSPDMQASVVIVQHIDRAFSEGLADWLGKRSGLRVGVAREGDPPTPGRVLLAGTDDHIVLRPEGVLAYVTEPVGLPYRPSVDVFLQSVASHGPAAGVAAVLTGMGRDGAKGLFALRTRGWLTFAQDEQSSVVWSMPRSAIEAGAACHVLSPAQIGESAAIRLGISVRRPAPTR